MTRQRRLMPSPLTEELEGRVLTPADRGYDEARSVFASHVDAHPALIVRAGGPGDIARLIAHARETGCELAVRGGGHSPAGHGACDGIVIDLSALRSFGLDTARREPGSPPGSSRRRPARTGSRPDSATPAPSGSAASRSPAASVTSCASTG
jgi:hypothetical protein